MCKNLVPIDPIEVTGWKVVVKKNGKYYSPMTGVEYKIGPVVSKFEQIPPVSRVKLSSIVKPRGYNYTPDMIGRTAVFKTLRGAVEFFNWVIEAPVTFIKMTILADMRDEYFYGEWGGVYAGKEILKIEEDA